VIYWKFAHDLNRRLIEDVQDERTKLYLEGIDSREKMHPVVGVCFVLIGILTGANMSGDLRDPQKSIPAGTILAQLTCSFIFIMLVFFYGGTTQADVLRDKYAHRLFIIVIILYPPGGIAIMRVCVFVCWFVTLDVTPGKVPPRLSRKLA